MTDLVTRIDSMSDGTKVVRDDELRVSTLELFFDLVFVFTITQLTTVLVHHPTGEALAQVVLMLAAIWWMYGAFAWLTNAVPPNRTALRLPLLAGMAAFFVISLTIPTAFSGDGARIVTASSDGTARVWNGDGSGQATVLEPGSSRV